MSVEIKKRFGATVSLYLDGHGYESGLDITCENGTDTAHKCPFAMAEIMPMNPGMACAFNDCGTCCRVVAKIRALTLAKNIISSELKKLQNIMIEE